MTDIDDLRSKFLDLEFDRTGFVIDAEQSATVAKASGETRTEFIDPTDPDFEACAPILASLASGRRLPIDFPARRGIYKGWGKTLAVVTPPRSRQQPGGN